MGTVFYSLTFPGVAVSAVAAGVVVFSKADRRALFAAVTTGTFLFVHYMMWITRRTQPGILTGRNFFVSLGVALALGAFIAYYVYNPDDSSAGGGGGGGGASPKDDGDKQDSNPETQGDAPARDPAPLPPGYHRSNF
jgi:hypothetical protein